MEDLKGGDASTNAAILLDVFGGQRGAVADALCLNAGVALAAAKSGLISSRRHSHGPGLSQHKAALMQKEGSWEGIICILELGRKEA